MKIALIDSLALTYSSKFAIPKLYSDDEPTGIIYGFMRYLLALQKKFNFDQFIFSFDSRRSKRKELFSEYKSARSNYEVSKLVYSQVDVLKNEILPNIGFNNLFESDGLEADDIIGSLCQTKNLNDDYIIISRDHDLWQLLNKNISQYDYVSKEMTTTESFQEKYNIDPIQYGMVKAIAGCKSDTVLGIKGIGEKSADKYLNGTLKKSSKAYQKIESNEGKAIIKRNKPLVILPFTGTSEFEIVKDEISFKALIEIFIKYNFQSQLTNGSLDMWRESFQWCDVKRPLTLLDY